MMTVERESLKASSKHIRTALVAVVTAVAVLGLGAVSFAGDAPDATALWKKTCSSCHGVDGKGDTKMGKKLKIEDLTNAEVHAKIDRDAAIKMVKEGTKDEATGKDKHKGFAKKLSDEEIAAVVDHAIAFGAAK